MVKPTGKKGFEAEEALRGYFRSAGYFVVRSIPLIYKKFDVTDIDLWLYVKATSLTADRICVDVKLKRVPRAMERVLWTKGLKEVLRIDQAIVVTSDTRSETRTFGAAHGIRVLQGAFLKNVITIFPPTGRLTEEDLLSLIRTPCIVDSRVEWFSWFRSIKSKLLDSLNFDGCNTFLQATKLLLDEYITTGKSSDVPVRLLYAIIAYFLICLDYTSRSFTDLDSLARAEILTNGFRYGEAGRQRTEEIMRMAQQFMAVAGKTDRYSGRALREEFEKQSSGYPTEILGEYFSKAEPLKNLFAIARSFEEQAYSETLLRPHETPSDQKAVIGLLCDLLGHDRKSII